MSTNDVPGANPQNNDELAMGCWAEHSDGSLIVVESTEAGRVVYSIFDTSKTPIVEYRDAMPEVSFKKTFTWAPESKANAATTAKGKAAALAAIKWTWHDKTPFPWDKVIKQGATDGTKMASASDLFTAAERVADSLKLRAGEVSARTKAQGDIVMSKGSAVMDKIKRAIGELGK